jgi:tetratricopeptide (TPR) repeat protein
MTRPLTLASALWQSVKNAWEDWWNRDGPQNREVEANHYNTLAYLRRGTTHLKAFEFNRAIADFTKAIEINPDDAAAYISRGSAHYENAEYDRARADFTRAIELEPRSANAHCNLGWTYEALGDEQKAITHYRKALEIDPSLEAARDNLKLLGVTPERLLFPWQKGIEKSRGQGS